MATMSRSIARMLAVSAALFGIEALAQTTTGPGQTPSAAAERPRSGADFEKVDANKDGGVDKKEAGAVPGLLAAFDKADANHDGRLDRSEFRIAEGMMKRS
jgi:hypothetical protein